MLYELSFAPNFAQHNQHSEILLVTNLMRKSTSSLILLNLKFLVPNIAGNVCHFELLQFSSISVNTDVQISQRVSEVLSYRDESLSLPLVSSNLPSSSIKETSGSYKVDAINNCCIHSRVTPLYSYYFSFFLHNEKEMSISFGKPKSD